MEQAGLCCVLSLAESVMHVLQVGLPQEPTSSELGWQTYLNGNAAILLTFGAPSNVATVRLQWMQHWSHGPCSGSLDVAMIM